MIDWATKFTKSEMEKLYHRRIRKMENAKDRGIAFTLSRDDWFMMGEKLLGKGNCDYCDLPFNVSHIDGEANPFFPSVERIDDSKGYIRGNVCVVAHRANQLKDNLIDKKTATTIIEPVDREIVRAMLLNMSKDHMESLKTKYIPHEEEKEMIATEEKLSQEAEKHLHKGEVTEEVTKAVEEVAEKAPETAKLPEDVAVALAYAKYCKMFADVGMNVSVTYAQFKSKYVRKVCALTGEKLESEPKSILIMDLKIGFAKDNFIVVSNKMEKAMTQLMISTGLSLPKVTAMLNKVI